MKDQLNIHRFAKQRVAALEGLFAGAAFWPYQCFNSL